MPFPLSALILLSLMFVGPPTSFFVRWRRFAIWGIGLIAAYAALPFVPQEPEPSGSGGGAGLALAGLYLLGALINVIALIGRLLREAVGAQGYR